MEEYEFYGQVLLLGDNTKYKFLSSVIKEELDYSYDGLIEVVNGKDFSKIEGNKRVVIRSPKIQKRKKLYICSHIYEIIMNFEKVDKLILFTSFPYEKQMIIEECNSIIKEIEIKDIEVIIYKEDRGFSPTDLTTEDDNINNFVTYLNNHGLKYNIFTSFEEKEYILNVTPNLLNTFKYSFEGNLENTREKFNSDFNKDYDFNIVNYFMKFSILNPKEFERYNNIFNYNRIKIFNDIWNGYVTIFSKEYLYGEGGIIEISIEFYENYIKDICFWNLDDDLLELENLIIAEYNNYFTCYKDYPMVANELEYIRILNKEQKTSLKILFKKRVEGYINKVLRNIIQLKIDKSLNQIKINQEEHL